MVLLALVSRSNSARDAELSVIDPVPSACCVVLEAIPRFDLSLLAYLS